MRPRLVFAILGPVLGVALASCGDDGADRRVIAITQTDDACTPASIDVSAGEKVTFEVRNDGKKDHEVEGIEGAKLEEVLVPAGRVRKVNYTAPKSAGTQKIKCYIPGGSSTIIQVNVAAGGAGAIPLDSAPRQASVARAAKNAQSTVTVDLGEYYVTPKVPAVSAGRTRFVARNVSKAEVHEVAVLRVKVDGSFENLGEIEDLPPGKSGELVVDLAPGKYLLACLIVPGEAGSTIDHFKQGMKIEFEVT